ncbi:MAG: beta-N-acetylhexosaminidase [Clostridia bacterium]|nr:beta-N-acetylhexosaminidase [Clostridia bacterium]
MFEKIGTMVDCSRNAVMKKGMVKKWIDITSSLGYNTLMLYTEDTYEVENQPYFGYLRGRYTLEELKELDNYASEKGVELIPCVQALAHLNAIFRWPVYKPLRDADDILMAGEEETYKLIEDMFRSLRKCFRTNLLHAGMDEAFLVGRGKYMEKNGYVSRPQVVLEHIKRVTKIAEKYGFELILWGDVFTSLLDNTSAEEIRAKIPQKVMPCSHSYYSETKETYLNIFDTYSKFCDMNWFAGGFWSWTGFSPDNRYSISASIQAIEACRERNVKNIIFTLWGDDGGETSRFSLLPTLFYVSEYIKGNKNEANIKEKFQKTFDISYDEFMLLNLPGTPSDIEGLHLNYDKIHLFNDPLMGIFDPIIKGDEKEQYLNCAAKLKAVADKGGEFSYLFRTLQRLCEVDSVKADFGVRLRTAYKTKNKKALKELVNECDLITQKINILYKAFQIQWDTENHPGGFDIQDIRFGTIKQRMENTKNKITAYLNGNIDKIEELEEELLYPYLNPHGTDDFSQGHRWWRDIVSPNVLSMLIHNNA